MATTFMARNFSSTTQPTQITTNIDNNVNTTNIPVQSTAGYPPAPFTGCLERNTPAQEFVLVTAVPDAYHFTVVRGYDGTSPAIHNAPATFEHCVGAIDYREANQHHTNTNLDDHTQYLLTAGSRPSTGLQAFPQGLTAQSMLCTGFPGYSYVQTRYVGGTAGPGPPGGGTFQVGDWVIDTVGCRWTCLVAGSPGTWSGTPGHMVLHQYSPGIADAANDTITWSTSSFGIVKGVWYVIDASIQTTIITAVPNFVNAVLYTTPSLLTYNRYIMTEDTISGNVLGNVIQGSCTAAFNAPSTENIQVSVNLQSSGSGGVRTAAGGIEIIVRTA